MAKMVKDSQRGQKSVITISKALPKYENAKPSMSLRDVELENAQTTLKSLEVHLYIQYIVYIKNLCFILKTTIFYH